MNYKRKYRSPYKSSMSSLHRKPANLYRLRSKGGGGSYRPRTPYTLSHNALQYQPQSQYRLHPEPKRSQLIIIKSERDPYHIPKLEYKPEPDLEELLEQLEKKFDERLESRVMELFEKQSIIAQAETLGQERFKEYVEDEDTQKELEADPEKDEFAEILPNDVEDVEEELQENEVLEEVDGDVMLADEEYAAYPEDSVAEPEGPLENVKNQTSYDIEIVFDQVVEANELEGLAGVIEPIDDLPYRPPEEGMKPNGSFVEMAESVLENPLLAYEIDPRIWPEIEALVVDLEAEQLEPKSEPLEPGY